jgi:hypothetical protein
LGLGCNTQGKLQDVLTYPKEYSPYVTLSEGGKWSSHLGLDYYLEGIYKIYPRIGLAVGYGHLSHFIKGIASLYILLMETSDDLTMNLRPNLSFEARYVYASIEFYLPVNSTLSVRAAGGVGNYFIDYSSKTEWDPFYLYYEENVHRTMNFAGNDSALGYHVKLGLEHKLFELMSVTAEVLYRSVNLTLDNVALESGMGSTIQELEWSEKRDLPIFDYDVSRFALPRFSFYIGIIFKI